MISILVAACGGNQNATDSGEKITIKHKLGETSIPKNPTRIVVFDYGILDSLDRLGVEVAGVPQNNLPTYLSKYKDKKYTNIGSLKEPDFEKISQLQPDLIIISGRQEPVYKELSEIAPTIHLGVDVTKYIDSFKTNMQTLGTIFNKTDEINKELTTIEQSIEKVKTKATETNKKGLVILANDNKVSGYGPSSRFGLIHDTLGVTPVDTTLKASTHGQNISFEYIVEKNPDYLFVIDRGAVVQGSANTSAKQVVENDLVKKTKAYQSDSIIYLDPNYWYLSGGGLVSVAEMIKEIEAALK